MKQWLRFDHHQDTLFLLGNDRARIFLGFASGDSNDRFLTRSLWVRYLIGTLGRSLRQIEVDATVNFVCTRCLGDAIQCEYVEQDAYVPLNRDSPDFPENPKRLAYTCGHQQ